MKRRTVAWLAAFSLLCAIQPAQASPRCTPNDQVCPGLKWPNGVFNYVVHAQSFASLSGTPLNIDQAGYWVPHILSAWKDRTGIQDGLQFGHSVTTQAVTSCETVGHAWNGRNEIFVARGCAPGAANCETVAATWPKCADAACTAFSETDICIYDGSARPAEPGKPSGGCPGGWGVQMNIGTNQRALAHVLLHEFGHALGLGHSTTDYNTTMSPSAHCQSTPLRKLFGDDIEGLRSVYRPSSTGVARWREMVASSSTWSGEVTVAPVDGPWGITAAVGKNGSSQKVIVTELSDGGSIVGWNRATYPLTSASTWDAVYATINTWEPIAVAARPLGDPNGELWVAAVTREMQQNTVPCPGIRMYSSANAFTNRSAVDVDTCGIPSAPALTYDQASGRFLLFFTNGNGGFVTAFTSTNGSTWQNSLVRNPDGSLVIALDGVDVACAATAASTCMMTFMTGDSITPRLRNQRFSVNATTGAITLSSATTDLQHAERTPAVGVRTFSGIDWMLALPNMAGMKTERSNGLHWLMTDRDPSVPFSSFDWSLADDLVFHRHRPDFASVPASSRIYLWYVR